MLRETRLYKFGINAEGKGTFGCLFSLLLLAALITNCGSGGGGGEAAGVVPQGRRVVGLGGEGARHAHRPGALLEDAEAGRGDRRHRRRDAEHGENGGPQDTRHHRYPPSLGPLAAPGWFVRAERRPARRRCQRPGG